MHSVDLIREGGHLDHENWLLGLLLSRAVKEVIETRVVPFKVGEDWGPDGPSELIGALEIDPKTGRASFCVTAIRFYADRLPQDIRVERIAQAYYLAACGNQAALSAVRALHAGNLHLFFAKLAETQPREEEEPAPAEKHLPLS